MKFIWTSSDIEVYEDTKNLPFYLLTKSLQPPRIKTTTGTCKQGERADLTGCTPTNGSSGPGRDSTPESDTELENDNEPGTSDASVPQKRKADRSEKLVRAKREGKGKEAKVTMMDGSSAPSHITPAMVPPAWSKVKISMNPDADILVQGQMKNAKGEWVGKTVYHPKYLANNQAAKFAKITEGLQKMKEMAAENQKNREKPELKEMADVVWLMQEQATRPGSDADTKGLAALYNQPFSSDNIKVEKKTVTKGKNKGKVSYKVQLAFNVDGKRVKVPIRDQGTAMELVTRKKSGKVEDAKYWLQSHGATTLEDRHVVLDGENVAIQFVGKEGVFHNHIIKNPKLADMLAKRKKATEAKGGGKLFNTDYGEVSNYTRSLDGGKFTPKDLRTARASQMAIDLISKRGPCCDSPDDYRKAVMSVATEVSGILGNKPAQALESYIAPEVFSSWRNSYTDEEQE